MSNGMCSSACQLNDSCSNGCGADLVLVEDVRDHVGDVVELHDLAVDDRVSLKVLEAEVEKLEGVSLFGELNGFHGTGADVETNEVLFSRAFFEHVNYSSLQRAAICFAVAAGHALYALWVVVA